VGVRVGGGSDATGAVAVEVGRGVAVAGIVAVGVGGEVAVGVLVGLAQALSMTRASNATRLPPVTADKFKRDSLFIFYLLETVRSSKILTQPVIRHILSIWSRVIKE
jgi:hypothetical protein